jgi:cleavage and polyadenylation specificity factor subunit 1
MLNFYRRFILHAAATQAPLHDILSGPKVKYSHHITWTRELLKAYEDCRANLSRATLLVHPDTSAPLALVTDASTSAMGAVLQQYVKNVWKPLTFFSKKFSPAQQKYSAYDSEVLRIYEAVKHFRHLLEARHFTIFTDHKPITYAFHQNRDKCSPRQFNHLDFIAQFTTDMRHISGQDKVFGDALSRVDSVTAPPSYETLAASEDVDDELRALLGSTTALRLEKLPTPGTTVSIYCDTSAGKARPFVQAPLWLQVFKSVHDLSLA